jgi:hypothetical protein
MPSLSNMIKSQGKNQKTLRKEKRKKMKQIKKKKRLLL